MSLDHQSILEATVMGIVSQGGPSVGVSKKQNGKIVCKYRGKNGTRCAVGFWIDDSLYQKNMEGEPFTSDRVFDAVCKTFDTELSSVDIGFFNALLYAHDTSFDLGGSSETGGDFFAEWEPRMRELCRAWKLRFPEELI